MGKKAKALLVGAAVAGAAYAAYKNKDKILEIKDSVLNKTDSDDIVDDENIFEDDEIDELDTTGDGKVDTVAIDNSGDGRPDELILDTTGDGKADTKFVDTTGDGIVDTVVDLDD